MTDDLRICTTCNGLGEQRWRPSHPAMNVYGWSRQESGDYRRTCESCNGTGYTTELTSSVPAVPRQEAKP